jgi:hydrogenase-4 component F
VINHGVTKALVFLVAGDAIGRYGTRDMRLMKGFLGIAPAAGTLLLMGAFSLAGTPPFSIFISELVVIRAGIATGRYLPVAVFLAMVVIIFAGLIHHVGQMAFGTAGGNAERRREAFSPLFAMALLAAVMLLFGVWIPVRPDRMLRAAAEVVVG